MTTSDGPPGTVARIWLWVLGGVLAAAGLFFIIGGGKLVTLGGSWYFLLAGVGLLLAAIQIVRGRPAGAWIFLATYAATVIWSLYDVGLDYWGLISRLLAMTIGAGLVLATLPVLNRADGRTARPFGPLACAVVLLAAGVAGFASMFAIHPEVTASAPAARRVAVTPETQQQDWAHYGNGATNDRFAALDQINVDNVDRLEVAWTYRTGDIPLSTGSGAEDQLTPLQVGDKVFLCTPKNNVIALDADTGAQIWRTDINATVGGVWERCRGLAYFDVTAPLPQPTAPAASPVLPAVLPEGATCERRIIMNSIDARLFAIDADTGAFCTEFGTNGVVDLKEGIGDIANKAYYTLTAAPTVAGTTIVIGGRVADNVQVDMPGGVIRGFDVITGALRWAFDTGSETPNRVLAPGETYTRSSANVWSGSSYDPATNTVFLPLGSPSVDLYGVTRTAMDHKYGATILALDATTGQEKWVYQTVHNDLWDFDIPMAPTLIDFPQPDGSRIPALVVATKAGQIFVLDRATGQPLTDVEERAVKPATIPNEPYALTQPVSVGMPQIGARTLTESDMWGATPFDQLICRISFKSMRYEGLYTAPDVDLSLSFPGSLGGMNWGGVSVDPNNDLLFINDMRLGLWVEMVPQQQDASLSDGGESPNAGMGQVPLGGTPYAVVKNRFLSPLGIPCQKPPFGTLTAVDLKTRSIAWQVPVGTVEETGPLGMKMGLPIPVGLPTLGGTLATQGGLVFFAGTQDYYLRAWDAATGKEIWKAPLPVGSQGGPMTYLSPKTGKQYVVISAGGARQSMDRGDYVIAFALPDA
ncbi:quinate dehydrogenase [Haematobacter missouriensis]|uniref:Membrane-bound PQQ-dependent dehydrogenase, glucose/quinate/shikimate family n=1 Tax=Haematobacter missouriensis TaxID=366616 RepID=A0A212AL92_9RHOB|nr:membrane-bound PQQ-dependent dehydrogenase, glucose/quinate/shikimate family [Haematobacter missouriensis]KFI32468.1 quinate dehydrogenase [Haematobacter missouriensis]OWJ76460.1 membrane-bound PQQ-dependent dehydrogenase, glucose/quinate/shikimate family [Haematobacter missouriensis]OWJ82268.1 membrane-bound PQQ-dependent dehydrogenase, glucose/quinate/shikimate family [Haematobacter missouriensis]